MANFSAERLSQSDVVLTDAAGRRLLLYGASRPGVRADVAVKIPVERAIACSPVELAFALRLHQEAAPILDRFTGILNAGEAHLVVPELANRLISGKLKNIESLSELKQESPEVIFTFMYPHEDPYLYNALQKYKTPNAVEDAWYEPDIVERIKWLEFFAYFFNLEEQARAIVRKTLEDIDNTARGTSAKGKRVLWFLDFQNYVFVTGGNSWVARSVKRLGGEVLTPEQDARGSVDSAREWTAANMEEADVIVFTMVRPSILYLSSMYPKIKNSPAYKQGRIYGFTVNYWQEGTYAPEKWFKELAYILAGNSVDHHEGLRLFSTVTT